MLQLAGGEITDALIKGVAKQAYILISTTATAPHIDFLRVGRSVDGHVLVPKQLQASQVTISWPTVGDLDPVLHNLSTISSYWSSVPCCVITTWRLCSQLTQWCIARVATASSR